MARPREFDMDVVLMNAMGAFWNHGYEATTLGDLMEVTGLQKGSIYKAFEDKHTLFIHALKHYLDQARRFDQEQLHSSRSPREAIRKWLKGDVMPCCEESFKRGCLMINTISELAHKDIEVAAIIKEHLTHVSTLLSSVIEKGQSMGQFRKDMNAKELANLVLTSLTGMITLTKCDTSPKVNEQNIKNLLKLLDVH